MDLSLAPRLRIGMKPWPRPRPRLRRRC